MPTRFAHCNLVAKDWRALAAFYERVLACQTIGTERDLSGPAIDALTGMRGAHIRGAHLRVPGLGPCGLTIEIFQYEEQPQRSPSTLNSPGLRHLAFEVDDVIETLGAVREGGGQPLGEVVTLVIPGEGVITVTYARDPEGNIIELQSWSDREQMGTYGRHDLDSDPLERS